MKFFAVFVVLAVVATAYAGKLPVAEQQQLNPESESEVSQAEPRDKRGLIYSAAYAAPYAAAYSYPYTAAYAYPSYAYAAPVAYRSAYYPSYYSSYVLG